MADKAVLADRTHRYRAPRWIIFRALADDGRAWWPLNPGEVPSALVDALEPERVVWSSPWPVSPNDTIEFLLSDWERTGTAVQFKWHSDSPPDGRGIGITRKRLNTKLGGYLRGWLAGEDAWRPPDVPLPELPAPSMRRNDAELVPSGEWRIGGWSFTVRRRR